ncbi:citramalate synthase [candidate division WOR-1 bacterium RIFOXYA12_FULL_43_27]|uniref:Citramalate synthase n=1 Tax=candidate division WOR-1 bacterium RIFOXYC2_FULL_46_14 TaxID=1802587 RepID=A0A1F4U5Q8_UNCSA|nr:MAG: citramalate synthase [candidate division WOR-1 bacterium RIFOXYA12_FULL_43_27]OGC20395.1 MAG: citramalate synthase [candidate division WOR-1 bacterium RIFOXYB2_FULL_46_45]OGC31868.1 MAG: citramalate synthase [candidate division WOR-1 bacterium RIFOXYA2_FULL_46_56]OGC40241.1 MAG: citramalate synthase [candidate division WOR-1 bacterium RIFOXYC2_FULL_46_14]
MSFTLFDTTLRDGAQTEGVSFTVQDKIKIAKLLDELGIHYIEGGWPGSNPKDIEFFQAIKKVKLKKAKIVAFSSTRRPNINIKDDKNIATLLEAKTPVVAIFGKCWDFQVTDALKTTLEENLLMIKETIAYVKKAGREVVFDAEHFFDGYKANPEYALKCLKAAEEAGADILCLCDTNGGTLSHEAQRIISEIKIKVKKPLGIHAHNDSECAVSVSEMAVYGGVSHVQGTINGLGERCGNANLCSIIPILKLKMGINCVSDKQLTRLTEISRHIAEIANLPQSPHQPFVGRSAFSHKGGIHVSAVSKNPETYEHIKPEAVGNERRVTVSELSGISNLVYKAKDYGVDIKKETPEIKELIRTLKDLEHQGYQFEEGEASFELLVKKAIKKTKPHFELVDFQIQNTKEGLSPAFVEARIKLKVKGDEVEATGEGDGPINALDDALRSALGEYFPELDSVKLTDYKVRVLDSNAGTAAKVRVIIESSDDDGSWGTVGVSTNVIEASWQALSDSLEYKLIK